MTPAAVQATCPTPDVLERHLTGDRVAAWIDDHIAACERCAAIRDTVLDAQRTCDETASPFNAGLTAGVGFDATRVMGTLTSAGVGDGEGATGPLPGYEILGEIHRGGQGIVYKAVQLATKRTVALKVLLQGGLASERARMRFEREVELAARLRHPHIVTVLESGRTPDGVDYLAIEFVDGVPFDRHVRELRKSLGDGSEFVRRVLELMVPVADAVHYAHQRGIIHRDIKPSNIMIDTAGEPRVLDFGIAKAIAEEGAERDELATMTGEFVGTFSYASPEQVSGDPDHVDIRTDVYALGVMLYESLVGRRPLKTGGSFAEAVRNITRVEPPRPRSIVESIDEDTETIVLNALVKEADQRYQSAAILRDEMQRRLRGEALVARRHDRVYMARKFLRRHWIPVSVVSGMVLLTLAFGVTSSVLMAQRAIADRKALAAAERESEALRLEAESTSVKLGVGNVMTKGMLRRDPISGEEVVTDSEGRINSVEDLLTAFAEYVETELAAYPDEQASLWTSIGIGLMVDTNVQTRHESVRRAERWLQRAVSIFRQTRTSPDAELAEAIEQYGRALWRLGDFTGAAEHFRESLAQRRTLFGEEDARTADSMHYYGAALGRLGRDEEGIELLRRAAEVRKTVLGPRHVDVGNSLNSLGRLLAERGDHAGAAAAFAESRYVLLAAYPEDDARMGVIAFNLARSLMELGRYDEAEAQLDRSFEIKLAVASEGARPAREDEVRFERARLAFYRGEFDRAQELAEQSLEFRERTQPTSDDTAECIYLLGQLAMRAGDIEAAAASFARASEMLADAGHDDWRVDRNTAWAAIASAMLGDRAAMARGEAAFERLRTHRHAEDPECRALAAAMHSTQLP